MRPATRAALRTFHAWTGLAAGLALTLVALSGAALIFRTPLEQRLDRQRFVVEPRVSRLPLDELVERGRAAHPRINVERVTLTDDATMPVLVLFSDNRYAHINPYTGAVLGLRARYGQGYGWIDGLHRHLALDPQPGRIVAGSFAFGYIVLALGGLALWWPTTRRALKAGFTLDRRLTGRAWNLNLHRTVGIWVALVILFNAVTGVTIAFETFRNGFYYLTGSTKDIPPPSPNPVPPEFAGYEAMVRRIGTLLPGAHEIYILPPKEGLVMAGVLAADAPHPNARSYVWLDSGTAEIVRYTPNARTSAGFRLYSWLLSVHTGATGGLPVKLALLLASLGVPVLAYTGVAAFLRRNLRRAAPRPATP
ncbi:MAG: hypothetical protein JWM88_1274 [Verrucomicrobia bacterium]|nr:hypothetical protein [Verrucomicrobiota bacterium]